VPARQQKQTETRRTPGDRRPTDREEGPPSSPLPLQVVRNGLRTQIGLLNNAQDWLICLIIIGVATAGKLGGSALGARLTGMKWRESLQLGALMNTRGLMELIALNIGYDMGILSQRIFTMLVIMALVTTVMTAPLVTFFGKRRTIRSSVSRAVPLDSHPR